MRKNWFDFADKLDVKAHYFYGKLIEAKASGMDWADTWVKLPKSGLHNLNRGLGDEKHSILWNGFEWVDVFDYETHTGKVYVRLSQCGELPL